MAAAEGLAEQSAMRREADGSIESDKRPRTLTKEMALAAAGEVVKELAKSGLLSEIEFEQATKDIADQGESRLYVDGYSLARDLENYCGWEPNLRMAEILGNYGDEARKQIKAAETEWVKRNDIKPALANGTRVSIGKGEFGEITGVYKYDVARYEVKIEGDPDARPPTNARRIVKFEDAKPAPLADAHGALPSDEKVAQP